MTESRDRLVRAVDIAELFSRRRSSVLSMYTEQPELDHALASPSNPQSSEASADRMHSIMQENFPIWMSSGARTSNSYRRQRSQGFQRPRNGSCRGRRGTNGILPNWYPRTPLRDITAVVGAIERLRDRRRQLEAGEISSPIPYPSPYDQTPVGVSREIKKFATPMRRSNKDSVQRMVRRIAYQPWKGAENMTPQKKLLNSIDVVNEMMKKETQRLKRTPSAKKEERERKVKTLMSLR